MPFQKGSTVFSISPSKFPKEFVNSRGHACIAVNNEAEVKVARKLLWEAIKLDGELGDISPPYGIE